MEITLNKIKPKIYLSLKYLIICFTALFIVDTIWSLVEPPNMTSNTETFRPKEDQLANKHSIDINQLVNRNLFGTSDKSKKETTDYSKPATKTQLPLTLLSVFASESRERSAAIISQRDQPPKRYKIQDTLPGNATLIEIMKNKVIFIRAGNREELSFPEVKDSFATLKTTQTEKKTGQRIANLTINQETISVSRPNQVPSGRFPSNTKDEQQESTHRSEGFESVKAVVEAQENLSFNKQGGMIVDESINSTYLRQTGLQQGDIILSVNGKPTNQVGKSKQMIQTLLAEGSARIEIQRGSRRFFITASIPR